MNHAASPSIAAAALVPYVHVADVERSLAFYGLFGLRPESRHAAPAAGGQPQRTLWASAGGNAARIMLALSSGPIVPGDQGVLFYVHAPDVASLRAHLLASGVIDAGAYDPERPQSRSPLWGSANPSGLVSTIRHPFYMPAGEMRVEDPDGYTILVGQLR